MNTCPVCKNPLPNPLPALCPVPECGWDLEIDITLNPSFEIPVQVLEKYKTKLLMARSHYMERMTLVNRLKELERDQHTGKPEQNKDYASGYSKDAEFYFGGWAYEEIDLKVLSAFIKKE